MIRTAMTASWVCLVVAGSAFGWVQLGSTPSMEQPYTASAKSKTKDSLQARQISMPVFKDGIIDGYFVMRFSIIVTAGAEGKHGVKIDEFVVDEAIRQLPSVSPADVQAGVQPAALAKSVPSAVNARLGASIVEGILFKEFTFVAAKDARR
jgi:hypothetical protein